MLKDALSRMAGVFAPSVLVHGQDDQKHGYVLSIRLSDGLLKARVKDRSNHIYDVHIDLKSWPGQPARCSCSTPVNCRHAAASLFAMQEREQVCIPAPKVGASNQTLNEWVSTLRDNQGVYARTTASHAIVYLLTFEHGKYEDRVHVRIALARRLKRKGLGRKVVLNTLSDNRKQFFIDNDEDILAALFLKCGVGGWFDRLTHRNSDLLEQILKTERAYLDTDEETRLTMGERMDAVLMWEFARDGTQYPVVKSGDDTVQSLLFDKPWYIRSGDAVLGRMNVPGQPAQLKQLLEMPPVALHQIDNATRHILQINDNFPVPRTFEHTETHQSEPKPIVRFDAVVLDEFQSVDVLESQGDLLPVLYMVDVCFNYEGHIVHGDDVNAYLFTSADRNVIRIERDFDFEKRKQEEIAQILSLRSATVDERLTFNQNFHDKKIMAHYHTQNDTIRLYKQVIPVLKDKNWQVEFLHPVYEELLTEDDVEWFSEFTDQGNDFFSYQLGIQINGRTVNIVPLIAELINRFDSDSLQKLPDDQTVRLSLTAGKALRVKVGRLKPLIYFLLQYSTRTVNADQQIQINRYQMILMREVEQAIAATAMRWRGSDQIRAQLQRLHNRQSSEGVRLPAGLQTELRDYQQQGLNWLQLLRESRFGGILADDMGLGKTVQTLAHLLLEKEQGRLNKACLIVAPTSLVMNWFEEAKRFTPALKALVFHGQERHGDEFDDYDLVISTYGLIQRDKNRFISYPFYYLILDEAQSIKNARTKTTQIIQQINASHRLCLSGTPLENHLGELWSLFHFLMPGLLGDIKQYRRFFKTPVEKNGDAERRALLAGRVRPFMLRRTKNQVARELPDKTEIVRVVELNGTQRDLYETIRMSVEKKVRDAISRHGMGKSHIVLLDALLKLRQVCCDPRLVSIPNAVMAHGTSAKLEALMELLESLIEEGRRVLIFSQFTSMLALIEKELTAQGYAYLKLTGQTRARHQVVQQFQKGDTPVFLISLKAGGTGLNLTRADTVIHYDPWWNPAAEDQATDRSHRIGQENPVFVYKLITKGTVEDAILAMQNRKRELFEGILADNATGLSSMTDHDLDKLFMPLIES
ncbi:DEAD/DEAH box helicase [Legionella spiritensis]|uniref:SNF2/RAD54 family transporter domain-containing protein n=1 Tax=Legionella spiritensis TaxID=452 RepID=A0A0W0YZU3_LEGSP|nr:DEAD/DEAH box helicase [Legionella spiritensis]KTD62038.1 SNF2/RAD54 family transporter domain-containing protein [Legionella spiritensis]SNV34577.1 DNA helicase, SNF2/RAD54 family domain protein [Legionella spiritensis]